MLQNLLIVIFTLFAITACTKRPPVVQPGTDFHSAAYEAPSYGEPVDLEQKIGDRVFFAFDSSALDDHAKDILGRQAEWLRAHGDVSITIEGHTDERGTRAYNIALGLRRANVVRDYLTSIGIDSSRVKIRSYGKEYPAVVGVGEEVWSQNRRAVTVINKE